jgi:MFS family permease
MTDTSLRALVGTQGVLRMVLTQLFARFPFGMLSIAFIIHIQAVTGSYAIAGIALGAETIGASISGPVLSRLMGRFGIRRVIAVATLATSSALLGMALASEPIWLIALGFLVGLSSPPVQPAVRTIYPTITPKKLLDRLYSLDATAQEILWVLGPVLATLIAANVGNIQMMYTVIAIQLLGSALFLSNHEVGTMKLTVSKSRVGGILKNPTVSTVTILGLLLVGSFAGIEVGAVAIFEKTTAGLLLAVFSLGSLIGGFTIGARPKKRWSLVLYLLIVLVGYCLVFVNPTDAWWMALALFIAGIGVAPALGYLSLAIAKTTTGGDTVEAYGWTTTGQLVGFSAGSALAGIAVDAVSATTALLVSVVFGLATLVAAIVSAQSQPKAKQ